MKSRIFKSLLSAILAVAIIITGTVSFSAAFSNETNDIIVLDNAITLNDNEIFFYSFNLPTENYEGRIVLQDENGSERIDFAGKDCVTESKTITSTPNIEYKFFVGLSSGYGGGKIRKFDKTGGVYRKVRFKLCREGYFNEDGSHTQEDFTYHFGATEYIGNDSYSSCLVIVSGGVINFVTPDKRGYVEFYTSTDIGEDTTYYTDFAYQLRDNGKNKSGGGGGINGGYIDEFTKGSMQYSRVSIMDVTELQRYVAKAVEFDKMKQYRADVDCNNSISIIDATMIQLYLAGKE